ncbi:MAG: hypothetical protein ABH889_00765 [Candidatus Portnoybacteria bacterium]
MKIKKNQSWRKVNYRDEGKFKFWSLLVRGEGDEKLANDSPMDQWKKVIILRPLGDPKTIFSMGFSDNLGNVKVSNATRRVAEGPFGMRMGPEDCHFFIASNNSEVRLELVDYTVIDESELTLY